MNVPDRIHFITTWIRRGFFLVGVFVILFSAHQALALDIQNLDYQVEDQVVGHTSQHVLGFDSLSAISIGNSLSIAFPSEFTFSTTPVQSDVEVRVNSVLLGVGDWSFSQASNTVFIVFQVSAAAGSDVEVTMTEDFDLVNPIVTDPYTIDFGVNASYVASAEVWFFPESTVTVTATVLGEPVVVGGGSGGGGGGCLNCFFNETEPSFDDRGIVVSFKGYGPPLGTVELFVDGSFVGTSPLDQSGLFIISVDNLSEGLHSFAFRGIDRVGVQTNQENLTLTVGERGFIYANDVFLPPTITVEPRGDYGLIMYGYTVPYAEVDVHVDGSFVGTVVANGRGIYFIETALDQFEVGDHTVTSYLKGTTRNLSSDQKTFIISSIFNSDRRKLEFTGEPLFDVVIRPPEENEDAPFPFLPQIVSFFGGAIILWLVVRYLGYHRDRRVPTLSYYEDRT